MKRTGINPTFYSHYLLSSFANYTGSHLAEVSECSHDAVSDFLRGNPLKPRHLWDRVKSRIPLERCQRGALVFDDAVLDKNFYKKTELKQRSQRNHIHCAIIAWLHLCEGGENSASLSIG